ncbi:phosphatidylglycerophosphatase A [Candidatus Magnetomoraceae bacterium gMMP-1]
MNSLKNRGKSIIFLATGCKIGFIPYAPGTFGTLAGLPLCYILDLLPWNIALLFLIAFMPAAAWISGQAEQLLGKKDPGSIVIDEIAGIMITFFNVPLSIKSVILGFLLFRFFDIIKPFYIKRLESFFSGGWGVLMDDVAAGILANLLLRIVLFIWN